MVPHKLQVIQNKALRFVFNVRYPIIISNNSLHDRAKKATVKDRLNYLRNKQLEKLNTLINDENDGSVIYKFSDYVIEDEPFKVKSFRLRNIYRRLGLLDENNLLN